MREGGGRAELGTSVCTCFSLLEPSRRNGVTLLVLQKLLGRLQELVAHVALKHAGDQVDLQMPLVHAARLAHKVAEHALKAWRGKGRKRRKRR